MQGGELLLLNTAGGATKDPKVRQAVAAAIDPKAIADRVYNGKGNPGNALFQKSFAFDPGVPGPKVDPALAKQHLGEAKAAGYDGKIRILCTNSPERQATALTIQTMLQAAGFDVTTKSDLDTQAQIIEMGKKDFDIACAGIAVSNDAGATLSLIQAFRSDSPSNRVSYKSTAFDSALSQSLAANTPEQKKAAFGKIAELYNQDLPALVLAAATEYIAWSPKVHGVEANQATMLYFDKAWIEH
jgi:peptide/nickel transport system substrate-binding protein